MQAQQQPYFAQVDLGYFARCGCSYQTESLRGNFIHVVVPRDPDQATLIRLFENNTVAGTVKLSADMATESGRKVVQAVMDDIFNFTAPGSLTIKDRNLYVFGKSFLE